MISRRSRAIGTSMLVGWMIAATAIVAVATVDSKRVEALAPGQVLTVNVPQAIGGRTVIGQLTVDRTTGPGFITAYACSSGVPRNGSGQVTKSDLNYNGAINPVASNRLVVQADSAGNVCFYSSAAAELIVDVNGVAGNTVTPFTNQRTDTRDTPGPVTAGSVVRVNVAEAAGGKTVFGQLTVDEAQGAGFVTAYGCADGIPGGLSSISKSDLNFDSRVGRVASNRLIVQADSAGDVCLYASQEVELIVDVNAVSTTALVPLSQPRLDTRGSSALNGAGEIVRVQLSGAGGAVVVGQLTVDRVTEPGFVTAFGCADGIPRDGKGAIAKSDLNYDGRLTQVASNRLVVQADRDGAVCFYTHTTGELIVDIVGVSVALGDDGITSIANQRTDTRPVIVPPPPPPPPPPPTAPPRPTGPSLPAGNPGNSKNCSDFRTQREAQQWFDFYFPQYGDVALLDADGDGRACESLP